MDSDELAAASERARRYARLADQIVDGRLPGLDGCATATALGLAASLTAADVPELLITVQDLTRDAGAYLQYWPAPGLCADAADGAQVTLFGEMARVRRPVTRQGREYAVGVLRRDDGEQPFEVLPKTYARFGELVAGGQTRLVTGRIDRRPAVPVLRVAAISAPDRVDDMIRRLSPERAAELLRTLAREARRLDQRVAVHGA